MATSDSERLRTSIHLMVIPRQSDHAVYHRIYGGLCLADKATVELLRDFKNPMSKLEAIEKGLFTRQQADSFIRFFASKRLLVPVTFNEERIVVDRQRRRERDLVAGRQIRAVQLILTNNCNLRCRYCFEALGETPLAQTVYAHSSAERLEAQRSPSNAIMTAEKAEAYLRVAIEMAKRVGNNALAVQFFGGEPLMNWSVMQHLLSRFGDGDGAMALTYSIVTNGSIVTEEMARKLCDYNVPVIVSYDAPKGDSRPLPSGGKTHDLVRRGIDLLQRYGNRLALNAALTDTTFDLFDRDLVDYALDHGIHEIGVVLDLDPSFYERHGAAAIIDKLWDVYVYGRSKGVVLTGYWFQIFQGVAADDRYEQIGYQNCSAMGVQLSIEPSGAVFACKASGGYFGNILQISGLLHSETYRKYVMRACISPERCQDCEIQHFCGGLCLGALEDKYDGDIWSIEDAACDVYRGMTHRLVMSATEGQIPMFRLPPP